MSSKTTEYTYDVPRNPDTGKAIIADPRNDQTLIVLQIHVALQMFHNKLVDVMRQNGIPRSAVFESARRLARWHYQWMVIHEFLPAIVGKAMADSVYQEDAPKAPRITLKYYKPTNPAGAPSSRSSSRWRHTASATASRGPGTPSGTTSPVTDVPATVAVSSVPLFEAQPTDNNLNGSRPLPPRLTTPVEQVLQPARRVLRTARPVRQFDANAVRRAAQAALDGAARLEPTESALVAEPSARARRWVCPPGSR